MKRVLLTALAGLIILGAFASSMSAFTMAEKVVVANELIAVARVPAGGFSAQERIDRVNDRLAYALGFEPLHPGAIYSVSTRGGNVIMIGKTPLITVTTADARANGTTPDALTRVWLRNAREALPWARPTPRIPG